MAREKDETKDKMAQDKRRWQERRMRQKTKDQRLQKCHKEDRDTCKDKKTSQVSHRNVPPLDGKLLVVWSLRRKFGE